MAVCPFSPFTEGINPGDHPLDAAGLRWLSSLYEAFKTRFHPREVDQLHFWEAAILLGVHNPPPLEDGHVGYFNGRPITEADQRRLEKFAQAPETDLTGRVMREMGITPG